MLLFGWPPRLVGERVYLSPARRSDRREWLRLRALSEAHLKAWEPDAGRGFAHADSFRGYWHHVCSLRRSRRGEGWLIFGLGKGVFGGSLLGGVTVSNMRFGSVQSASLGYWVGQAYVRQGVMSEALDLILQRLFFHYGLNRVEAAILPNNNASRALLVKLGFQYEGRCRQYLRIGGHFEDHFLYSLLARDYSH